MILYGRRKGQVTLFIILGIVLLIGFGLFFVFRDSVTSIGESDQRRVTAAVPSEYQPLKALLDQCLRDTTIHGLKLVGVQGGYIYPEEYGIEVGPNPTTGKAVAFFDTGSIVPYWYRMSSANDCQGECQFEYQIPALRKSGGSPSIEREIEKHIDRTIKECTNNFDTFRDQGYVIEEVTEPRSEVTIGKSNVNVLLKYEVRAESLGAESTDLLGSYATIPLDLESIYTTAFNLASEQQQYQYIDRHVINLIYGFSGLDTEKLPPPSDTAFDSSGGVSWDETFVESSVTEMLASNILLLQVPGSLNYKERVVPSENRHAYLNRGTAVPLPEENPDVSGYNIMFQYLPPPVGWDPYFHINCDGTCKPQSASSNLLMLIGIQRYKFFYDVSVPVLVTVESPFEFDNDGYRFQFLLESNVRNNDPLTSEYSQLQGVTLPSTQIGVCDEGKRNSGEVTITSLDASTREVLPGASVLYSCADEVCAMGKTDAEGILLSTFPTCLGGFVQVSAPEFEQDTKPLSLDVGDTKELVLELKPRKEIPVVLLKKMISIDDLALNDNPRPLENTETAVVSFKRIPGPTELDYQTSVSFGGLNEEPTVQLSSGRYLVTVILIQEEKDVLDIPDEEIKEGLTSYTLEGTTYDSLITGGGEFEIVITEADLSKDQMILYTLAIDHEDIETFDDLSIVGEYNELSVNYQSQLQPVFT